MSEVGERAFSELLPGFKDFGGRLIIHDLLATEAALADGDGDNHRIVADALKLVDVAQAI